MRIDNPFLSNLAISVPSSSPETGDGTLSVPALVLGAIEPIHPMLRLVGSGATVETSINTGIAINRNNQAASGNIMATFSKGLFELDVIASARFNFTAVATGQHTYVELRDPTGANSNSIIPFFAVTGVQTSSRKIRILFGTDGWTLRLSYGATGVAENLDAYVNAQITKIL